MALTALAEPQLHAAWKALTSGARASILIRPPGDVDGAARKAGPGPLFPGAFDPLHAGHRQMLHYSEAATGRGGSLEVSLANVDKGVLTWPATRDRVRALPVWRHLWLTRAPTFRDKARLFPGTLFVVGIDTLLRIDAARYYADSAERAAAIEEIASHRCRFLVFGRQHSREGYRTLEKAAVGSDLQSLCTGVSETAFRVDVSSTQLRGM